MKPEEIDRQIAEKIMGWKLVLPSRQYQGPKHALFEEEWQPSTKIAHAMQALKMFEKDGWLWTMSNWMVDPNNIVIDGHLFDLWKKEDEKCRRGVGSAESPEMAMCLAFIDAVKDQE